MPRLLGATALALMLAIPLSPTWPWGGDGHKTIGAVADIVLQQHAITQNNAFHAGTISSVSLGEQ